jgi:hypothetical protein
MSRYPGPDDLPYLRANFVVLDELARAHGRSVDDVRARIEAGSLPRPAYELSDGTSLVAPDYFALSDAAGGDGDLRDWFHARYADAAAGEPAADPAAEAWDDYLTGFYAKCLRSVTPSTIVRKAALMARIESLIAEPREGDLEWLASLREAVDALDVLERPFAEFDRVEGPVSRDRLIAGVREQFLGAAGGLPVSRP